MKKSVRLYISGTVQGIFYRGFIKENAEKLGIKGFVRNLEDGRVEIFCEGNPEEVKKMIAICKKGPRHAEIKKVEEKEEKFQNFKTFKVLHI
jgi:acylphosphatase